MSESSLPSHKPLVLVAEDDAEQRTLVERWLEPHYHVKSFGDADSCIDALSASLPEAVCLDLQMPGTGGMDALERIIAMHPRLPVLILTADAQPGRVVEAMRLGAYDYLVKPLNRTKLQTTLHNAIERGAMAVRLAQLETEVEGGGYAGIVGDSPPMRELFRKIERVAQTEISVLVHGESGTGKELVAEAIHARSARSRKPYVALNCAAIPEGLQESELFGHEKGAFSGASAQRTGRFEEAHGGTLFLDEVAELSLSLQAKLLRVLQERTFRRVGGEKDLRSDFRLVTATHRNLADEVEAGRFREDLFYRVSVFDLDVPALRERGSDLRLLVSHFLDDIASRGHEVRLASDALEVLRAHPWPGNVRELRNALERGAVVAQDALIQPSDLPGRVRAGQPTASESPAPGADTPALGVSRETSAPVETSSKEGARLSLVGESGAPLSLAQLERRAIEAAFERTDGNRSEMARLLGIGRTTLYRKLKEFGIS